MNDIKINYTAFLINDWKMIIEKHLFIMKNCRLYNKCTQFNIYAFPKNDELIQLLEKYDMTQKTQIIFYLYQQRNRQKYQIQKILTVMKIY